jgi:hypothetical protein
MAVVWILSVGNISAVTVAATAVVLTAVMPLATVAVLPASAHLLGTVVVVLGRLGRSGQVGASGCRLHLMRVVLIRLVAPFVS